MEKQTRIVEIDGVKLEIAPAHDLHELHFQKADVTEQMNKLIEVKKEEVRDLERKKAYFETYFGRYFETKEEVPSL